MIPTSHTQPGDARVCMNVHTVLHNKSGGDRVNVLLCVHAVGVLASSHVCKHSLLL